MIQKNKLVIWVMAALVVVSSVGFINPAPAKAATTITNCAGLAAISGDLDGDYVLGNNIDCSGVPDWTPLGNFTGKLDGAGFAIQHLTIVGFDNSNGFFTSLETAKIFNLSFTDANVQAGNLGGILAAASNSDTKIVNVHVQGEVNSDDSIVGGIIGYFVDSQMYHSSADVDIVAISSVGGLVGASEIGSTIEKSFSTGTVEAVDNYAGGLAASNYESDIIDSYSRSSVVVSTGVAGGLVASNTTSSSIVNSYSTGSVSGSMVDVGGLVGVEFNSTTEDSYWDTQTSGQAASDSGTGKTTLEMQTEGTFVGWDFDDIWDIDPSEYPTLVPYDSTAPVLTLTEAIPGNISANATSAIFRFTMAGGSGYVEMIMTPCGHSSNVLAEQLNFDGDPIGVEISGLESGKTYSCEAFVRNITEGESNHLTIGPFTVGGGTTSGSRAKKKDVAPLPQIPNQQTPGLTPDQQVTLPGLGVNSFLTRNLYFGLSGSDVKALQQYLNNNGFKLAETGPGSPGNETEVFGPLTRAAVIKFQQAKGITPAVGYVGPITRRVISGG